MYSLNNFSNTTAVLEAISDGLITTQLPNKIVLLCQNQYKIPQLKMSWLANEQNSTSKIHKTLSVDVW